MRSQSEKKIIEGLPLDHLWKIQQLTAVVALMINTLAVIINIVLPAANNQKIVNIGTIALVMLVFFVSLFVNNRSMRYLQSVAFLLTGMFTILFDANNRYIGDILFITGILLAYTYHLINTYSYKTIAAIIATLALLRLVSAFIIHTTTLINDITIALFSITLIVLLVTLLKNELVWYITESQKNEIYIRAGMNITGFAHSLDLGTALNIVRTIKRKIQLNDYNGALRFSDNLTRLLSVKNKLKETIVFAANQNRGAAKEDVDIHKTLETILGIVLLDKTVAANITIRKEFDNRQLVFFIDPFEIYFIFHNLIVNSLEAMLMVKKEHTLVITTLQEKNTGCVFISGTGPGFIAKHTTDPSAQGQSYSANGGVGGFGLIYTFALIRHNNIKLEIEDGKEGGARVKLTFNIKGEKNV